MKSAVSKVILVFLLFASGIVNAQENPSAFQKGLNLFGSNNFSEALRSFRDVILDPSTEEYHGEAYYWIARSYLALEDYDNAEKALEFYLLQYADHRLYPDAYYQKGRLLFLQKEYENAIRVLYDFLGKYPDHSLVPNAYYWIAESLFSLGSFENARRVFSLIPEKFPTTVKVEAAQYRVSLIDLKEREEVLLDMIKMSHEEYIKMLEDFQTRERTYKQALDIYQQRLADAATADKDGLIATLKADLDARDREISRLKNQILALQEQQETLKSNLSQTQDALTAAEAVEKVVVVQEPPKEEEVSRTPLTGTGVEQLLELKARLLDIREYYLNYLAAELEGEE
ncbi:MAG: tetratricopeptide repeat protein [Spirochaetales bacterium]|nr:tetratricopeptide repeat protein [Spirochaetales bacterium]